MEKKSSILAMLLAFSFAANAQNNSETIDISIVNGNQDLFQQEIEIQFPADVFAVPENASVPEPIISLPSDDDFSAAIEQPIITPPKEEPPKKKPKRKTPVRTASPQQPVSIPQPYTESIYDNGFSELDIQVPLTGQALAISELLKQRGSINWQGVNNKIKSPATVKQLYAGFNFQPLWTQDGKVTQLAANVIQETLKAGEHALRPEMYHSDATSSLKAGTKVAEPEKFDVILSDAFVTYKSHLTNGVINPKTQFVTWNSSPRKIDFVAQYNKAKSSGAKKVFRIYDKGYLALQKAYLAEIGKPAAKSYAKIPAQRTLRMGAKGKAVTLLRERLDMPTDSDVFDAEVKAAVRDYQKQNGLGADGIAGKRTLRHMNGSGTNHIEKLAINMERHRWGQKPSGRYVWVNIPAYKMAVKKGSKSLFQSNVIVGRPERPTPVFRDKMEHVVLAPYWNVPKTIFTEDKLPKLQKNPQALGKNMQVIEKSTGKVVNASSVNWKNGGEGYRLRQLPGKSNALGRMKFLFPNRHAIYLHDTPNRKLFKKSRRAFSSGCVRVEKANDFALFMLDDKGYNNARLKQESQRKKEKWINLNNTKRYPVYLDYYTAWADENGKVRYELDIYGYDKPLIKSYQKALKN